jgi:hypothetical protein
MNMAWPSSVKTTTLTPEADAHGCQSPLSHKGKFLASPEMFSPMIFSCQMGVETTTAEERSHLAVFTLDWRFMILLWANLARVQHPPNFAGHSRPSTAS